MVCRFVLKITYQFPMNTSMTVNYKGDLHCDALHIKSGTLISTDAPTDNKGKGESFSPTDLTCVSLATCILTTMAISAEKKNIPFKNATAEIEKIMADNPRRIQEIVLDIKISDIEWSDKERTIMQNVAHTCPVSRSLHPDVKQSVNFIYL